MNKRYVVWAVAMFSLLFTLPSMADASERTVDDAAGLFTAEQIQELNEQAELIEKKTKAEVFIVTTKSNREDPYDAADYYLLDTIGKDENGVILYIDMLQRKFIISRSGNMIDFLDDKRTDNMLDKMTSKMTAGNYFAAAQNYLSDTNAYVDAGVPKGHYRMDTETGKITYYKTLTPIEMLIAFGAALVLSGGFVGWSALKYKLKFSGYRYPLHEKTVLHLTEKEDHLKHSFITTRHIPKHNSGGRGGSGGSSTHNTGGGTFSSSGRSF